MVVRVGVYATVVAVILPVRLLVEATERWYEWGAYLPQAGRIS